MSLGSLILRARKGKFSRPGLCSRIDFFVPFLLLHATASKSCSKPSKITSFLDPKTLQKLHSPKHCFPTRFSHHFQLSQKPQKYGFVCEGSLKPAFPSSKFASEFSIDFRTFFGAGSHPASRQFWHPIFEPIFCRFLSPFLAQNRCPRAAPDLCFGGFLTSPGPWSRTDPSQGPPARAQGPPRCPKSRF